MVVWGRCAYITYVVLTPPNRTQFCHKELEGLSRSLDTRAGLPHRCAPQCAPLHRTILDDNSQGLDGAKHREEVSAHCIAPRAVHPVHRRSQTSHQILLAIDLVSSRRAGQGMSRPDAIVHTNRSQITSQMIVILRLRVPPKVSRSMTESRRTLRYLADISRRSR